MVRLINLYNPLVGINEAEIWIKRFNKPLLQFRDRNIQVVNIYDAFAGHEVRLLSEDGIHPMRRVTKRLPKDCSRPAMLRSCSQCAAWFRDSWFVAHRVRYGSIFPGSYADSDWRADGNQVSELNHIIVVHADAAFGYLMSDGLRLIGPVYTISLFGKPHPVGAIRTAWIRGFIDDRKMSDRRLRNNSPDSDRIRFHPPVSIVQMELSFRRDYIDTIISHTKKSPQDSICPGTINVTLH